MRSRGGDCLPDIDTRSGKIMRRLLGDTTTLEDYSVLARLREAEE